MNCYAMTSSYCGRRFGQRPPVRLEQCRRLLANEINATLTNLTTTTAQTFDDYRSCFRSYRRRVDANCTELLRMAIADRPLRAVKTVRATMESMGPLLRALPALRVIHLVRDPRSVAVSRCRFVASGRGLYTEHVHKNSGSHPQNIRIAFARNPDPVHNKVHIAATRNPDRVSSPRRCSTATT